jgi:hypothetical protein
MIMDTARFSRETPHPERLAAQPPLKETATLRILRPRPSGQIEAAVLDLSRDEILVWTPVMLRFGTLVQVQAGAGVVTGTVRSSIQVKNGFHLGVRIEDIEDGRGAALWESVARLEQQLRASRKKAGGQPELLLTTQAQSSACSTEEIRKEDGPILRKRGNV